MRIGSASAGQDDGWSQGGLPPEEPITDDVIEAAASILVIGN
jgi:hypothetical protein